MICSQTLCNAQAAYLFTWPGKPQAGICEQHVHKLRAVAEAMSLYLEVIPRARLSLEEAVLAGALLGVNPETGLLRACRYGDAAWTTAYTDMQAGEIVYL